MRGRSRNWSRRARRRGLVGGWCGAIAVAAGAWGGALASLARAEVDRPEGAGRLIASWDFEERSRTIEPVPRHWFRSLNDPENGTLRPGFPKFNLASFDDGEAAEGLWSIKLPTHGGSTSLKLAGGVVPSMPDGDVLVTAMVRTEGLVHARARIVAQFLDDKLRPLPDRRFTSDSIITGGVWRPVSFEMIGAPEAAWVTLELQVLQPDKLDPEAGKDPHTVYLEDVNGAAWFDELRLYQIPRVRLRTQSSFNVVEGPARPQIELRVQDLTGEELHAELSVWGIDGRLEDRVERIVYADGRAFDWSPELEGYGWYRATARIHNDRGIVGQTVCDLAWLAPGMGSDAPGRRRFGVVAPDRANEELGMLPEIVRALGTGSLWMEVWGRMDRQTAGTRLDGAWSDPWDGLARIVERLLEQGQEITFVLDRAPLELASRARVDADNPLRLMGTEGSGWMESLGPLITRFGERVRRWQVGAVGSDRAFFEPGVGKIAKQIHEALFRLIPRPIVVLAWEIAQSPRAVVGSVEALTMWVPYTVPHNSIAAYSATWPANMDMSVALELAPLEAYGVEGRIRELAKRGVESWAASGVDVAAIEMPWVWRSEREGGPTPTSAFVVWRTLAEELAGRRYVGDLPLGDGLRVLIAERFDRAAESGSSGMLIAWNESAPEGAGVIHAHLGQGAVRVCDVFGNEQVVESSDGKHTIALGRTPVFIEGVDGRLLRFRARMRLEPGFIETRAQRHDAEVVLENPWPTPIEGVMRIGDMDGWEVTPRVLRFSIAPGEEVRLPVSLTFGLNEAAGDREIMTEVALQADRRYPVLDMPLGVELGLSSVELSASYQYTVGAGRGGIARDLVVTLVVTNTGTGEASYEAFAIAPGFAAREAPVTRLGVGESTVRRFIFDDGVESLRGKRVRVGLREVEGTGRLNRWLEVR